MVKQEAEAGQVPAVQSVTVKQERTDNAGLLPVPRIKDEPEDDVEIIQSSSGQPGVNLTRVRPAVVDADQLVSITCKLCKKILIEPVGLFGCGHNFCGGCLSDLFIRSGSETVIAFFRQN